MLLKYNYVTHVVLPVQCYREIDLKHKLSFLINYLEKSKLILRLFIGHDLADLSQLGLFQNMYMLLQWNTIG